MRATSKQSELKQPFWQALQSACWPLGQVRTTGLQLMLLQLDRKNWSCSQDPMAFSSTRWCCQPAPPGCRTCSLGGFHPTQASPTRCPWPEVKIDMPESIHPIPMALYYALAVANLMGNLVPRQVEGRIFLTEKATYRYVWWCFMDVVFFMVFVAA